jgi:HTH-type transcriptional regulator/antitoxin HigA
VFEKQISKTALFGSARWLDADHAIIQMSLRMKSNDHFWWTFFHEAAHILLHRGRNFADDQNGVGDGLEDEADRWAEEMLVGSQRSVLHGYGEG